MNPDPSICRATDLEYKFWVQKGDFSSVLIGTARTKDVSNEVVGGFTGLFIGMYASGNEKDNINPTDFEWFDFEENPAEAYNGPVTHTD